MPMQNNARTPLETAADSNVGLVRTNNEDRFVVVDLPCDGRPGTLALVADGVGGHAAGEVASQTAVDTILRDLRAVPCADPVSALPRAVVRAGRAVYARSGEEEALRGMGTTLAAAWVIDRRLYTVTVGDSRIYLHRGGRTIQASIDHTWVQEAVEHGMLTPEQARIHPNAHVLRRHLGGPSDPVPDQRLRLEADEKLDASAMHQGLALEDGDAVVLCSDGLSDLVKEEEIERSLRHPRLDRSVEELIDLARNRGGHDNITVVAIRVPGKRVVAGRGIFPRGLWALLFLALLGAAAVFYLYVIAPGLR
jgi:serine/threonine protein phosphatase PrpC